MIRFEHDMAAEQSAIATPGDNDEAPGDWKETRLKECFIENNRRQPNRTVLSLSYGKIIKKDLSEKKGVTPESFDTYQGVHPKRHHPAPD